MFVTRKRLYAGLLGLAALITAGGAPANPPSATDTPAARFKAAGRGAALTVFPATVAGKPIPKVGEVVALLLEKGGMTSLETADAAFTPADNADLLQQAKSFGEFVRARPVATEYALFADFRYSKEKTVTEIRIVVVDRRGDVVWQDRQAPGDADFDRAKPREPLSCCLFVANRLRPVLALDDPSRPGAGEGKLAERWRTTSGIPDAKEQAAINERSAAFKKKAANSSLLVYPTRVGKDFAPPSAADIAGQVASKKLARATAADQGPRPTVVADINEQKVLWTMAKAVSEYVRAHPPAEDYVLFADYVFGEKQAAFVHFVICDRTGQLVVADYQNSHHADFKAVNPKARADCDALVVKRLEGYCK